MAKTKAKAERELTYEPCDGIIDKVVKQLDCAIDACKAAEERLFLLEWLVNRSSVPAFKEDIRDPESARFKLRKALRSAGVKYVKGRRL